MFRRENNPYGFIGRDGALLELERAMHRPPAGILIQGLGGIGKTTLARGFVRWLEDTNGLDEGAFWLDFRDIRSAEYVLNRIGEPLFGASFGSAAVEGKLAALVEALREHRFVIVWDNFESASGIAGTPVTANLPEQDRALLARFLDGLRGGATKILITSRSEEDWLGPQRRWKLPLRGFDGEERWEYCEAIVRDLGLSVNRQDKEYADLMKQLGGHPLAMRVILPQLEKRSASEISKALRGNLKELKLATGDEAYEQLFAALRFIEHAVPESLRPLLQPLSLHEAYVDLDNVELMAKQVPEGRSRAQIDQLAVALSNAGLLRDIGQATYELHPALTGYLRSHLGINASGSAGSEAWNRAFVDVMGDLADSLAARPLHEQRGPFYYHGANFHTALAEAGRLGMESDEKMLLQSLAQWALNTRDFGEAERMFLRLSRHEDFAAGAYHQLGRVAQARRDFAAAEQWYLRSLAIKEKEGDEHGAAATYYQLGTVVQEKGDLSAAEQWYRKSLAIEEKSSNEHGAAITYRALSILATKQRKLVEAGGFCLRALAIFLKSDPQSTQRAVALFVWIHESASASEKRELEASWAQAGLGPFPPPENS